MSAPACGMEEPLRAGSCSVKAFSFDPSELAGEYERQGWIHVPGGATDEFCDHVRDLVADTVGDPLHGKGIGGSKEQLLLEFPLAFDFQTELLAPIANLAGLDAERMTISERHVKMYLPDADPIPRPHKDRFASQVALGISIEIPTASHLVLYPDHARNVNPLLRAGLIESLPPAEQPEQALVDAREVAVFDSPGDVVAFPGASVWHSRRQSASTIIVYLKCNDFGSDPLGEDPRSVARRELTCRLLADDVAFQDAVPQLSSKFESVSREYGRDLNREWLNLNVWDQPSRMISEHEFDLLRAVDNRTSVSSLAGACISDGEDHARVMVALRRLSAAGALDLSPPPA
jgi:hypothetical protein